MNIQIARDKIIKFGKKDVKLRNKFIAKSNKNINASFKEVGTFDKITTDFLKKVVDMYGVPNIPKFGRDATLYGWLIAQHTQDLDFQKKYLELLKKEDPKNIFLKHIAYLEDRINMYEKKPQKYGTQLIYDYNQMKFVTYTLLDEENIDKYRKEMGMDTLKNYLL